MKKALILFAILSLTCTTKAHSFDINQHAPFVYLAAFISYGFYHFCIQDQDTREKQKEKELLSTRNLEAGTRFVKMREQRKV